MGFLKISFVFFLLSLSSSLRAQETKPDYQGLSLSCDLSPMYAKHNVSVAAKALALAAGLGGKTLAESFMYYAENTDVATVKERMVSQVTSRFVNLMILGGSSAEAVSTENAIGSVMSFESYSDEKPFKNGYNYKLENFRDALLLDYYDTCNNQ